MKMPVLFIGHGSPMNIIADNSYTLSMQELGRTLPKPSAVLVISAHWQTRGLLSRLLPIRQRFMIFMVFRRPCTG